MSKHSRPSSGRSVLFCLLAAAAVATGASTAAAASASAATTTESISVKHVHSAAVVSHEKTTLSIESRSLYTSTPVKLDTAEGHKLLAFPPAKNVAQPMTVVYLHGVNGKASNGCPWLRSGSSELGWLVCPEGVQQGANGTASWGGDVFKQGAVVSSALHAAQTQGASTEPGVAVGFSQGGYVALDLVKAHLGNFRGLVLIAAPEAHPSAAKLHEAGIKRVALAAGALDGAHAPLVADAKRLASEGMETRFFDLGRVGHTYAAEDTAALREAIAWAGGIQE